MSSENIDTRERILVAAWELLEGGDAKAVRVGDIAKRAGISRQALYLHFATRAELLIATTRYIDQVNEVDLRLAASRAATGGVERLDAFVRAWAGYIPEVYGVAKALIAMKDTDDAAAAAWNDRMRALRHGCAAAVKALNKDGKLAPDLGVNEATDLMWSILSVGTWELLTREAGWSRRKYATLMQTQMHKLLVRAD